MTTTGETGPETSSTAEPTRQGLGLRSAWYALIILTLVNFTALLDRYLVALMLDPIRAAFTITDTQASLLHGLAFALLYSMLGLPFGRWVDRGNRRNILMLGVILWSFMTILCGLAPNYSTLFVARLGVGVGEACLAPAAYSFLTDMFPPERRGRALAYFMMGTIVGGGGSFIVGAEALQVAQSMTADGALLAGYSPWRVTFVMVGAPGLLAAALLLTLREPARRGIMASPGFGDLKELFSYVRSIAWPLSAVIFAGALFTAAGSGAISWFVVFLSRTYGLAPSSGGHFFGMILITTGIVAALVTGNAADSRRIGAMTGEKSNVAIFAILGALPLAVAWPFMPSPSSALILYAFQATFFSIQACAMPAVLQDILPNRFRGQITALYWLVAGLVGFGGGATMVAFVTEEVFGGPAELRYSLAWVPPMAMALGMLALILARPSYQRVRTRIRLEDLAATQTP